MAEKKIVIQIDEKGAINAETFGMTGPSCVDELDKLMKDIALSGGTSTKKDDYFNQKTQSVPKVTNKHD